MAPFRALLASTAVAAVAGLSVHPHDEKPYLKLAERTSRNNLSVSLDPELTNVGGEKFHVTQPGEWLMIGVPETASLDTPREAQVLVTADFKKMGSTDVCEDLIIRSITVLGFVLGTNVTNLTLSVSNDIFNSSAALGLHITQKRGDRERAMENLTPEIFMGYLPGCSIRHPRGMWKAPTKRSYRHRTTFFTMECDFIAATGTQLQPSTVSNKLIVWWSALWHGKTMGARGEEDVFYNDISFSIGNVGTKPVGLLGTDDHTDATKAIKGCNKAQPFAGPFQTRSGPKEKPWQRRHREQMTKQAAKKAAQ